TVPWTVSTCWGRGADAEVTENTNGCVTVSGGNGLAAAMNARWSPGTADPRNEYVLLRFDLPELDPAAVQTARLGLTAFRAISAFNHRVYAVNHDVPGQLWDEATVDFAAAPALNFDGNPASRGLMTSQTTLLGEFNTSGMNEGQTINFASSTLAQAVIQAAEQSADGVITLIIERVTENSGQSRFATKEATHLQSTAVGSVAAGTYAPRLQLQLLVPEDAAGDFNGDGVVDGDDLAIWQDNFGMSAGATVAHGDATGDGVVDGADFLVWQQNLGAGASSASAANVPEPAGWALALAAGGRVVRRRHSGRNLV
ncbi:MAG TPA: hypothetical protein PJ982_11450, partial [Lacipirellulaceae bacterium]|nr:hypothetical protein [Lacipirellulaceae bacterium]